VRALLSVLVSVLVLLAGCAARSGAPPQLADRGGVEGAAPDFILDVTYVEVYRNIDHFPNIARVCVRAIAFAVTSTGEGYSAGATPLIRVPDWDAFCASKEPRAPGAEAR
jgi:hypothetical protein